MPAVADAATTRAGVKPVKANTHTKPSIEIRVDRHFNSKVYTSGSTISGTATVKTQRDARFDDFDIIFTGIAATRLDFVQQYPSHSFRPFMKLRMPIDRSALPEDNIFLANQEYAVPFTFIVPHQLTIGACNHHCSIPAVREQHLRLPPTVGFWEGDDMAPEMAQIEYSIKARAYRKTVEAGEPPSKIMEGYHMLKVLPSLPEDAPLDITYRDERYNLSKAKTIRKNIFSAKAGKLTATASQPSAVMLSSDGRDSTSSSVRIALEFAPTGADVAPPKINSISGKITAATFFGAAPTDLLPNLGSRATYTANPSLSYTATNNLFNNKPSEKLQWQMRNVSGRRDSGYSSLGADEDASETDNSDDQRKASSKKCPLRHSTTLEIPFNIPQSNRKIFLPTFHSCLISRTYTLHLSLSVGPTNTAMTLAIPLQIGVDTIYEPQDGALPSFESVIAEDEQAEANAHLEPRMMRIPDFVPAHDMLPGYEDFSRRTVRVA